MNFSVMGTGQLPSALESERLGISEDDRRKTRNALKAIRKARREGRKINFVPACSSDGRAAPVQGRAAGSIPAGPTTKTSTPGVTHAAGRGDLNDRNTVNSEAAAGGKRA